MYVPINGERISVVLRNPGKKKIILFCHGFPGTNRLPNLEVPGYTIAEINYRGDEGSEGEFSLLGSMDDIVAVARALKKEDTELLGLGYSLGGLFVHEVARSYPELFDRVVLLAPVVDATFLRSELMKKLWKIASSMLTLKASYDDEIERMIVEFNPSDHPLEDVTVVHGDLDDALPIEKSLAFNPSCIVVPGATHDFNGDEPEVMAALTSKSL